MGTDATSGHFDHTVVVDPLKTVGQLGLPDGYATVNAAIEDVFGRPNALNGFAIIKDGDAYKAEAFAVPPTGVESMKPTSNVAAVVIGDSVLTPHTVGGSLQLQDSGHVQAPDPQASGLPQSPYDGLADDGGGDYTMLGKVDTHNPSAGYGTVDEALGAALQIDGVQTVAENSKSGRYFVMDTKSSWLTKADENGDRVPDGFMALEATDGYMLPSSSGRWRDPSTFKS
jgi:hypothetical protein